MRMSATALSALGLVLLFAAPARAQPRAASATDAARILIVDVRAGDAAELGRSRSELRAELLALGLSAPASPELDRALAGSAHDEPLDEKMAALKAAAASTPQGCSEAMATVDTLLPQLAKSQAGGQAVTEHLRTAWAIRLVCADATGIRTNAQIAAARLRTLGVTRGSDINLSDAQWEKWPDVDAHPDSEWFVITVAAEPAVADPAEVWIDHRRVGVLGPPFVVARGSHVIAVVKNGIAGAREVDIRSATGAPIVIDTSPLAAGWSAWAQRVGSWKSNGAWAPLELGALLSAVGATSVLVLTGAGSAALVEVWERNSGNGAARFVDRVAVTQPMAISSLLKFRGPDPDLPLLREDRRTDADARDPVRWWMYAGILGAAALGTVAIWANESREDTQRIEVTAP